MDNSIIAVRNKSRGNFFSTLNFIMWCILNLFGLDQIVQALKLLVLS
jgi:hypothetical protein